MELQLTGGRVLRLWWAFFWRHLLAAVAGGVLGAIAGFLAGFAGALLGWPAPVVTGLATGLGAACGLGASLVAVRAVLNKDFGPIRLSVVPSHHERARARLQFPETVPATQ